MYIYFVATIILFIFAILYKNSSVEDINKNLFGACIGWALIFGLRGYGVGNDTPGYAGFFEGRSLGYGTINNPDESLEWGFLVISRIIGYFTKNGTIIFLLHGFLFWFLIYFIYKDKRNSLLCLIWMISFGGMITTTMVAFRQSLSICLFLLGFMFFSKVDNFSFRNLKNSLTNIYLIWGVFFSVLSVTVHRSSVVIFVLIFIFHFLPISKYTSYVILTVALLLSIFYDDTLSDMFDGVLYVFGAAEDDKINIIASRYVEHVTSGHESSLIRRLSLYIPAMVTIYYNSDEERKYIHYKCIIIGVVAYMLFSASSIIGRMIAVYIILGYSHIIPKIADEKKNLYYFYLMCTIYYLWRFYEGNIQIMNNPNDTLLPYSFFWEY